MEIIQIILKFIKGVFMLAVMSPLFMIMGIPAMAVFALIAWICGWINADWWIPVAVIIGWISGAIMYAKNF